MFSVFSMNLSQFDRTTRIQKQDDRNLFFIQEKKICCFSFTQIIVSFYPAAVFTLSGNTAQHIHSCFCICDILCFKQPVLPGRIKGLLAYASNGL